ncbi:MAG: hypothetical protein IPI01_10525 [Ignavibacteriae bacterium]|nr:hypothetical protein [Ignavibacteriota bacterium]
MRCARPGLAVVESSALLGRPWRSALGKERREEGGTEECPGRKAKKAKSSVKKVVAKAAKKTVRKKK